MRAVGAQPEAGGRNPDPVRDVQRSGYAKDRATTQHLDVRCQSLIVEDSFPQPIPCVTGNLSLSLLSLACELGDSPLYSLLEVSAVTTSS